MQGFGVVQAKKRRVSEQEPNGYSSRELAQRESDASALSGLFKKKGFNIGVCAAGAALFVVMGVFDLWKSSVHSRFENLSIPWSV